MSVREVPKKNPLEKQGFPFAKLTAKVMRELSSEKNAWPSSHFVLKVPCDEALETLASQAYNQY